VKYYKDRHSVAQDQALQVIINKINMFDGVLYVMHLVSTDGDWQSGDKHNKSWQMDWIN